MTSTAILICISKINNIPIKNESSQALDVHLVANNPHNITTSTVGAITVTRTTEVELDKNGTIVTIPSASTTRSGLMSPLDKSKLDNLINQGVINIEGSGAAKNAASFGFLPTKDASENVIALQNTVKDGGTILVDLPGTYEVDDTILLPSNTTLIFGANTTVSLNANKRFLLNSGATTKTYNENISIYGLTLKTNGYSVSSSIVGLRGYIAFFYVKNLVIDKFTLCDGASGPYVIHVCTFENAFFARCYIEGYKDAIHIGRGNKFVIRDCVFRT